MNTEITKENNIKNLLPSLFKKGLKIDLQEEYFKDCVNSFFRNKKKMLSISKIWEPEAREQILQLKFDDRLNMFFLYRGYDPVIGFYYYNQSIQLVPFNNNKLLLGVALIIEFTNVIGKLKNTNRIIKKRTEK